MQAAKPRPTGSSCHWQFSHVFDCFKKYIEALYSAKHSKRSKQFRSIVAVS